MQGLMAFDALVVALCLGAGVFVSATEVRHLAFDDFLSVRISLGNVLLTLLFLGASHYTFLHCGMYRSRRLSRKGDLYRQILQAVSICVLLLGALAVVFRIEAFDRSFLLAFWISAVITLTASRSLLYGWLEVVRARGRNLRRVLIVGAGARGRRFVEALENRAELGYSVLGFLDEGTFAARAGSRLLGTFDDLPRLLRSQQVDEVAVALPIKTFYSEVSRIVALCERQGVVVRLPGDLFDAHLARMESEQFEDLTVLTLFTLHGSAPRFAVKRLADIIASAAGLAVSAPLLGLIALAVRLASPGPALFSQLRIGQNGRRFRMWKFRTMTVDAEARLPELEPLNEVRGAAFKIRNDPRVTRLGRWLRRTSLDELPQLINVLKGDMSLVGPRPMPLRDADRLSEDWQRRRFSVRPGLTCLWQAGGRHSIPFDDWMRLDLDYIDNWSLLLDLKILLRTVPAVWSGAGAS